MTIIKSVKIKTMILDKFKKAQEVWKKIERLRRDIEGISNSMSVTYLSDNDQSVIYDKHYKEYMLSRLKLIIVRAIQEEIDELHKEFDAI